MDTDTLQHVENNSYLSEILPLPSLGVLFKAFFSVKQTLGLHGLCLS